MVICLVGCGNESGSGSVSSVEEERQEEEQS